MTVHPRIDSSRKPEKVILTAVAAGWESGNPAQFAGFPNEVGKSVLLTFPRSGFSNPDVQAAASEGAQ